jgi:hypothetical protein
MQHSVFVLFKSQVPCQKTEPSLVVHISYFFSGSVYKKGLIYSALCEFRFTNGFIYPLSQFLYAVSQLENHRF